MNLNGLPPSHEARERALDAALGQVLRAPQLPAHFRARLEAAMAHAESVGEDPAAARARIELERRQRLAELESGYVRLQRRTLGTLIGGAFAAGAAAAVAMPWLRATFGPNALLVLAVAAAGAGVVIGLSMWLPRGSLSDSL